MKEYYAQPKMPFDYEIENFVNHIMKNHADLRRATRIIAQGYRDGSCLFFKLPKEINHKIAHLTGNSLIHDEKSSMEIVKNNFSKP